MFWNWLALTNPVEMFLRFDRRAGFRTRLSPVGTEKPVRSFRGCSHRVSRILGIARAERCVILVRVIVH